MGDQGSLQTKPWRFYTDENMLTHIIISLLLLNIIVVIHEWGHFITAKAFSVKVIRFSIGFKPFYKRKTKAGYTFCLGWIPLGGFVELADSHNPAHKANGHGFDQISLFKRSIVLFAGPAINFLAAFFALWIVFQIPTTIPKPIVIKVLPNSIAAKAMLPTPSIITKVNQYNINSWQQFAYRMFPNIGSDKRLIIQGKMFNKPYKPFTREISSKNWRLEPSFDLIESLGLVPLRPKVPALIDIVVKNGPADQAGIQKGDLIISINGQNIHAWLEAVEIFQKHPSSIIHIKVKREAKRINIPVKTGWKFNRRWQKQGYVGLGPKAIKPHHDHVYIRDFGLYASMIQSIKHIQSTLVFHYYVIIKLMQNTISLSALMGPVGIFNLFHLALQRGILAVLNLWAALNIAIAFFNLLPIPALDGGQMLFLLIEKIRKKPLSPPTQTLITRLSIILLLTLIAQATINDFMR
jgi:regulator of sigma E protease